MSRIGFKRIWLRNDEEMGRDREEIKWRFIVLFPLLFYWFEICHNNRFKINKGTLIIVARVF